MKLSLAAGVAALALVTLSACGDAADPSGQVVADPAGTTTAAPTDPTSESAMIEHPTGADDVIVRILTGGGYVPFEYAFINQPSLVVTGDGRVIFPAAEKGRIGHRLVAMQVAQVDEDVVQAILTAADEHGLLAKEPDYEMDEGQAISDAPTTTVSLAARGGAWEHAAYALNFDGGTYGTTGPRAQLAAFIDEATALVPDKGAPFEPDQVRLLVSKYGGTPDRRSTVHEWPTDLDLSTLNECSVSAAGDLPQVLADADMQTYFSQDGVVYSVSGADVLPGDEPCADGP